MTYKIISISKAKETLLQLSRKVNQEGQAYIFTRDGEPVSALVPVEDYEALLETTEILSNPATMKKLEAALLDEKKNNLWKQDKKGNWTKISKLKKVA